MSQCLNRSSLRLLFRGAAVFSLLLVTVPALAAKPRAQEKVARKACLAGDPDKGVAILADLFVETRDPVHIFNQGRCFEQNRRYEDAIARFEEYLRADEASRLRPEDRAAAEKHIADCRSHVPQRSDKAEATTSTLPPSFVPPQPVAAPIPEPSSKPQTAVELVEGPKSQSEPSTGRSRLLIAGIIVGVVGVAAVGAGVGFNLKANATVTDMTTKVDNYSESKDSSRKSYETLAWAGYGVGAALVATGVVLVAVGAYRQRSSSSVALVPTVGSDQAGVLLHGAF